jgi:Kef-type K+ transport system membrane component KefB
MITKVAAVWPTCRSFKMPSRETNYTTCMMSTGLTFGSISALYGLNYGYVTQAQYSLLVTAVIGSAVIPTVIGQIWFYPHGAATLDQEMAAYSGTQEHFLHMPEDQ